MLNGIVYINEQETSGNYKFTGIEQYLSCGFQNAFGKEAQEIATTALELIVERHPNDADYLQIFEYHCGNGEKTRFWCINDVDCISFLLPEEN